MRSPNSAILPQLADIPFFDGLTEGQWATLAAASREQRLGKDALLFLKGDRPTGLFAVLAGTIKLACQSPRGEEKVIDLPGPGQVFGEAAMLLDCPYPFAASALTPARLLHIDGPVLRELIASSTGFAHRMMSRLSHGICTIIGDLEDYRMRAPQGRIARFLLDRAEDGSAAAITLPAPKNVFASRLGMVPESLSRAMRDMAEAGLIEIGKDYVRVLDRQGLAGLVD